MALDKENKNPAYLCGRLFAVLEFIQRIDEKNLNRTIKDAFFASACSRPSAVFPRLVVLSQNHIRKIENKDHWSKTMGDIINELGGSFPHTLSLDEQGQFIVGYYQQNALLFAKKTETGKTDEATDNN